MVATLQNQLIDLHTMSEKLPVSHDAILLVTTSHEVAEMQSAPTILCLKRSYHSITMCTDLLHVDNTYHMSHTSTSRKRMMYKMHLQYQCTYYHMT
jgi:hypothetical protein